MSFIIFANFCSIIFPQALLIRSLRCAFIKTKKNSGSGIISKVEKTTGTYMYSVQSVHSQVVNIMN